MKLFMVRETSESIIEAEDAKEAEKIYLEKKPGSDYDKIMLIDIRAVETEEEHRNHVHDSNVAIPMGPGNSKDLMN